jgi:hypothetical protein
MKIRMLMGAAVTVLAAMLGSAASAADAAVATAADADAGVEEVVILGRGEAR